MIGIYNYETWHGSGMYTGRAIPPTTGVDRMRAPKHHTDTVDWIFYAITAVVWLVIVSSVYA